MARMLPSIRSRPLRATLSLGAALLALGPTRALAQFPVAGVELPSEPPPPPPPSPPPVLEVESPPERAGASSWQLDATLRGAGYSINESVPVQYPTPLSTGGERVNGDLQVTRYLGPIVDDDAPRSLQPFLQRASVLYADVGGGGFLTRNPTGGQNRTDAGVGATLGLDIYVLRQLALTASLGYGYDILHDVDADVAAHAFSGSAGLGVRISDVRIDASYAFAASEANGSFAPLRWGQVNLAVFAVIDRRVTLNFWGELFQQSGGGGIDFGVYPTQDLGLFLDGAALRGELYASDTLVNRYYGSAGLSYWVTPRVRLGAYYELTVNVEPVQAQGGPEPFGSTEFDHAGVLQAEARLP
jgi:hypothetical protein